VRFFFRCLTWGAIAIPIGAVLGVIGVIVSGVYPIAANRPHLGIVAGVLTTLQKNAVERYAAGIDAPSLADPTLVRTGLVHYRDLCMPCHGSPGTERQVIGRGLNPPAPRLAVEVLDWTDAQLFWIVRNGLKMTGMPAFSTVLTDDEVWAVVAYLRRQVRLSRREYEAMVRAIQTGTELPPGIRWLEDDDHGLRLLLTRGDPERGRRLIEAFGCGTCHFVPGIREARGYVGPPLTRFAERHYIAGTLMNTPEELVAWIVNPQAIEPGTVMPNLGVGADEALDIAAYLYTLGETPRALRTIRADLDR
jgi:mono/diheme cytochrome c family protein